MFRKLLLSGVLSVATLGGLGMTVPAADAHPPIYRHEHEHEVRFEVLCWRYGHWDNFGTFRDRFEADRFANMLRHQGFGVRIEMDRC
jgi:hypothetical protein